MCRGHVTWLAVLALSSALPVAAEDDPYTLGMRAFAQERWPQAVSQFQAALERRPDFPPYNYMLAMSYLRNGDRDAAITTFRAVVVHPDADDDLVEKAYVNLLRTLVDAGRYEEVEAEGAQARARIPQSAEILHQIGRARLNVGNYDAAVAILTEATQYDSSSWTIFNTLGLAYLNNGNFKGARHAFERAVELNGRLPLVYNNLGVTYEKLGQYDAAMAAFNRALEVDPAYSKARSSLNRVKRLRARSDKKTYIVEP